MRGRSGVESFELSPYTLLKQELGYSGPLYDGIGLGLSVEKGDLNRVVLFSPQYTLT